MKTKEQFLAEQNELNDLSHDITEAYHKVKMSEITDEDIEKWANTQCLIEPMRGYSWSSMVSAAKAMLDGLIKHESNET